MAWCMAFRKVVFPFNICSCRFYSRRIRPVRVKTILNRRYKGISINYIDPTPGEQRYGMGRTVFRPGMERILRNLGMSESQFVCQNPISEDLIGEDCNLDEDHDYILDNADRYFDIHEQEKKDRKKLIRYKKYMRKHYPEPQETNLLTVAAKEQIKYLNELDPINWNPEVLSKSFPISLDGVKKLLRSNYLPKSDKERERHDNTVYKNIKLLKEGSKEISIKTQKLWQEGKLKIEYSQGNKALPISDTETKIQKEMTFRDFEKPGEFLLIVKPYLELMDKQKAKTKEMEIIDSSSKLSNDSLVKENLYKVVVSTKKDSPDPPNDLNPHSFPKFTKSLDIKHEKFSDNIGDCNVKSEKECKLRNSNTEDCKENENKLHFQFRNIPKYNDDKIEYIVDSHRSQSLDKQQPYLYDENTGYQHPLGEAQDYPDKIEIPEESRKEGKLYRVGNCYYDDEGEFLYKIFS